MPRPRKYNTHKVEAYDLYTQQKADGGDVSALDIQVLLEEAHPEGTASYRLVANWVKEFKNRGEWQTLLDSPFQWHRLEEYRLPWEASAFLMDFLFLVEKWREEDRTEAKHNVRVYPTPLLSVRQALWCWRVHLAAPEIGATVGNQLDVLHLARKFSGREILANILEEPLYMADLDALLVYKPWLNEDRHQAYHRAVDEGAISSTWPYRGAIAEISNAARLGTVSQDISDYDWTSWLGARGFSREHPELLRSQQVELFKEQVRREKEGS